jgi:hypothetical protein
MSEPRYILQLTSKWLSGTFEMVGDVFLLRCRHRRFLLRFQDERESASLMWMALSRDAADEWWAAGRSRYSMASRYTVLFAVEYKTYL